MEEFVYGGVPRSRFEAIVNRHIKGLTTHYMREHNLTEDGALSYIVSTGFIDYLKNPDNRLFMEHLGILIEAIDIGHEDRGLMIKFMYDQTGVKPEFVE